MAALENVLEEKLKTPEGRKTAAKYMADYLQDVAKHVANLEGEFHRRMCQNAARILYELVKEDLL